MSEKLSIQVNVKAESGPGISVAEIIEVDAYDKIDVDIEAGASDFEVQLQPGVAAQVQLLAVKPEQQGLTYKLDTAATAIALDEPLLLIGKSGMGLLDTAPQKLFFGNASGDAIGVQILVGRMASPPPP